MKPALIIFVKNPEKGKVKTRLAATVGDDEALRIYVELLNHTRRTVKEVTGVDRFIYYSKFIDEKDEWTPQHFNKKLQNGSDLGGRLTKAFEEVFKENQPVLVIGSDCASLSSENIENAIEVLKTKDFVIGPAIDGGYYLLGMNSFEQAVFQEIEWSTEAVFPQTRQIIKQLNKTVGLLPELSDIDREEDWKKWGW